MDSSGHIRALEFDGSEEEYQQQLDRLRSGAMDELEKAAFKEKFGDNPPDEFEMPLTKEEGKVMKRMSMPRRKNKLRNIPCPCGSGKKFKKCCWSRATISKKPNK